MDDKSKTLLTLNTQMGLHRLIRLAFGNASAPGIWPRVLVSSSAAYQRASVSSTTYLSLVKRMASTYATWWWSCNALSMPDSGAVKRRDSSMPRPNTAAMQSALTDCTSSPQKSTQSVMPHIRPISGNFEVLLVWSTIIVHSKKKLIPEVNLTFLNVLKDIPVFSFPGPPWFEFWSSLTFLHHRIEQVERHLLWKFHKTIQRKSWSNVSPKLLTCIGFLYKVVHKVGRLVLGRLNLTFWSLGLSLWIWHTYSSCSWLQNVASDF